MTEIRMRTSIAGPTFSYRRGEVVSVSDDRAESYCMAGVAERVAASPESPTPAAKRAPAKKTTTRKTSTRKAA